jgi:hypothetical protein
MADQRTIGKKEILNALGQIELMIGDIRDILEDRGEVKDIPYPHPRPKRLWDCPAPKKDDEDK